MKDLTTPIHNHFLVSDGLFYEQDIRTTFSRKRGDYYYHISQYLDYHYSLHHKKPWTYCQITLDDHEEPVQGWKIHISATLDNHIDILQVVAKYATENKLSFKFATCKKDFIDLNGKSIERSGAGKFIVVYPRENMFEKTIEDLYCILKKYEGPYILSDKKYKDSNVVYYRYGEINPMRIRDEYGMIETKVLDRGGKITSDKRVPYFTLPKGILDPFGEDDDDGESILLEKYNIKEAIHFSAQGGVYVAYDKKTKQEVIVKEARKYAGLDYNYEYAETRIKREFFYLKKLKSEVVPNVIELLDDGGNTYLIEEKMEGICLHKFPFEKSPMVDYRKNLNDFKMEYRTIVKKALESLNCIHRAGYIVNDISPANIIYNEVEKRITFIDFETMTECGAIRGQKLATRGFDVKHEVCNESSDLKKLILTLAYCVFPFNNMYEMFAEKIEHVIYLFYKLGLIEEEMVSLFLGILKEEINSTEEALQVLNNGFSRIEKKKRNEDIIKLKDKDIQGLWDRVLIKKSRTRGIIYCDPMGYMTNTYCLAFGIFGLLYVWNKNEKREQNIEKVQQRVIEQFVISLSRENYSSGLFVGLAGIALAITECGNIELAENIMSKINLKNVKQYDLAYGLAGIGIVLMDLYAKTSNKTYIESTKEMYNRIIAEKVEGRFLWKDPEGDIYSGLTRGSSGIALMCLYLYLNTSDKSILESGKAALEEDINAFRYDEQGLLGFDALEYNQKKTNVFSPYVHNGLAGIGMVAIRYYIVTKDEKYLNVVEDIVENISHITVTLFPGFFRGMCGIICFLQDCVLFTENELAKRTMKNMMKQMELFFVKDDNKLLMLGDELFRVSDDLATGLTGYLLVSFRGEKKENDFLVLDYLLKGYV